MFTREDFKKLTGKTNRDDVIRAVGEIPDEDIRTALVMTVSLMNRNIELENAVWRQKNDECNKLKKELNAARAEIERLKNG